MNKRIHLEKTVDIKNSHDAVENILNIFTIMPQQKVFYVGIHNNFWSENYTEIIKINS